MTCTQNRESGGKTIKNETLITVVFHSRLRHLFHASSVRSESHFFSPFIYIIGGSENIINDQQLIESAGEQRESVWSEKKVSARLHANWVNILANAVQFLSACRLVEFFISTHAFLSCFSHFAHHTSSDTGPADVTRRRRRLYDDEKFAIFNQRREKAIFHHIQMKKLPHSLQLAYQHYIYFFDECSIKYHLGSSWDLINFSSKACQSESKHWRQISSHRSDWRDMSTHHMFTERRRARLVSRKYTNIITPIDDIESRNYLSRHFSGRR